MTQEKINEAEKIKSQIDHLNFARDRFKNRIDITSDTLNRRNLNNLENSKKIKLSDNLKNLEDYQNKMIDSYIAELKKQMEAL